MEKDQITKKLEEVIHEVIPDIEDIDMSASITDEYGVDSISLIKLIVATESKFDVSFTDYELDLSSYDTFIDIADVVADKLNN